MAMSKERFKEFAKDCLESLKSRNSCTDLYISTGANVAVIGIQNSGGGAGYDSIYILDGRVKKPEPECVLSRTFCSGRMWPTGISKDGKKFTYTIKDESGHYNDYTSKI